MMEVEMSETELKIKEMRDKLDVRIHDIMAEKNPQRAKDATADLLNVAVCALRGIPQGTEALLPFIGIQKVPQRDPQIRAFLEETVKRLHSLLEKLHGHSV